MHAGIHPMLNMAIRAARKAGDYIHQASDDLSRVRYIKKEDNSFVSQTDEGAQSRIIEVLQTAYPDHHFISEEMEPAPNEERTSHYTWYIDPLDGTGNFIHGFPYYAVSIALAYKDQIEHAVVYNPVSDELFYASKGAGAFLNNTRIRVSKRPEVDEFLLGSNLWFSKKHTKHQQVCDTISKETMGLRRMGCSSLDLANVAAGRLDAFFAAGLNVWDMAAGSLLIQEAGGFIGDFKGDKYHLHTPEIVVGGAKAYDYLIAQLQNIY
jgi:myo-inositol-1(or 4)-monophosphatase